MTPDRLGSVGFALPSLCLGLDLGELQDALKRIAVARPFIVKHARHRRHVDLVVRGLFAVGEHPPGYDAVRFEYLWHEPVSRWR